MDLSAAETRVLACLLEKQRTTPDIYPLTLNALRSACNQSTNRDPVVDFDDAAIRIALHRLDRRGLVRLASGRGSRAPKYRHLLDEALPMSPAEQAVMCVLMLRGPQTPGELKQRTERQHAFADLESVQMTLQRLIDRGLAASLGRRPGQKEERYVQLLGAGDSDDERVDFAAQASAGASLDPVDAPEERPAGTHPQAYGADALAELQERVARLEREVASLRAGDREQVSL